MSEEKNTMPTDIKILSNIVGGLNKEMNTKMKKLLWARASTTPIGFRHDRCELRVSIRYNNFKDLDSQELRTIGNDPGIIVIAPPEIVASEDTIDKFLISRLGSNEGLSCVIGVEGKGTREMKQKYDDFKEVANKNGWSVLDRTKGAGTKGNDKWRGHYFVKLQGSGVDSIEEGCVPLANDALEYADDDTQFKVKAQLLHMMLSCRNAETLLKKPPKLVEYKQQLTELCNKYNLLDYSKYPVNPIGEDGFLRCWSGEELSAENFMTNSDSHKYLQKCHIDSVASSTIGFDKQTKMLKTVCRPYGFLWGTRRANLLQSQGSMEEALEFMGKKKIAEQAKEIAEKDKEIEELRRRLAKYETV